MKCAGTCTAMTWRWPVLQADESHYIDAARSQLVNYVSEYNLTNKPPNQSRRCLLRMRARRDDSRVGWGHSPTF